MAIGWTKLALALNGWQLALTLLKLRDWQLALKLRDWQLPLKLKDWQLALTLKDSQLPLKLKDWQLALLLRLCMQHLQQAIPRTVKTARWRLLLRRRRRLQYGNYSSTGKRRPRRPYASS